jgi:hypothetical protein
MNSGVKNKIREEQKDRRQEARGEASVMEKGDEVWMNWKIGHDGILKELIPPAQGKTRTGERRRNKSSG